MLISSGIGTCLIRDVSTRTASGCSGNAVGTGTGDSTAEDGDAGDARSAEIISLSPMSPSPRLGSPPSLPLLGPSLPFITVVSI